MSEIGELDRAISKHAQWKIRLRTAIDTGQSEWTPEAVQSDRNCDFGKWLHALSEEEKRSELWGKVAKLHANFHMVAAKILRLALDGRQDEANSLLTAKGGEFADSSVKLINAMADWKKILYRV